MRKAKMYLLGSLTVAGAGLVLRFAGMAYNVYISDRLGAGGMGLLSLVLSVYSLAVTLASAGIQPACTALTAEALSTGNGREARRLLSLCTLYSLFFGILSALILFFTAPAIGRSVLKDARAESCLRALCPALPAVSLSACFGGYFNASRRAYKSSLPEICAMTFRLFCTAALLFCLLPRGKGVEAVLYGSCASELLGFFILCLFYVFDRKKHLPRAGSSTDGTFGRLCGYALPVALAACARSALVTAEHVTIPRGLEAYGSPDALGLFGVMHGMALPVIFFPYAILSPFTALLMPEIARLHARDDREGIAFCSALVLRLTLLFAFFCAALFCFFGLPLGSALYTTGGVGRMIVLFSPLVPVMYADTATDAVLKGLGEQVYCMKVNVTDAALSLLLVWLLVPRIGAYGYLLTVFLSECFNTFWSVRRLTKRTRVTFSFFRSALLPALCAAAAGALGYFIFKKSGGGLLLPLLSFSLFYPLFLWSTGAFLPSDRRYLLRVLRGK